MKVQWVWLAVLPGCAMLQGERAAAPELGEARATGVTTEILVRPQARPTGLTVPDTVPEPQGVPTPEVSAGTLGRTIASLGDASKPGLWLETPLVDSERTGRLFYDQTGKSVSVSLIPIAGPATAGSRMSLAAMQALGAPLTGLPEVDVFGF